ncbi:antitoxin [Chlorobium sp. KB01]|uniref:antitoxin n=1 Tax=Chlorobium sp. KB01 TaxID=1917528 RepID=UPI00097750FE|nr:antitoxin [Chlorobium sp. KB01]
MNKIEEAELIKSVEAGEWTSVADLASMKERLAKAAAETALKDYRINVRISKRDVEALKTKALEEGIPYQTLVTSILHKYVTGRIIEKKEKTSA